jgi:Uma2 family endonuclease
MTAIATQPVLITPSLPRGYTDHELDKLADDGVCEFIDGHLVEKDNGAESNWTAARLGYYLSGHMIQTGAGDLLSEQSFRCFPDDPRGFRRPDLAFVAAGRIPSPAPLGPLALVPDLLIEVTSPTDRHEGVELKLAEYRAVGVPLVWVVIPAVRLVRVIPRGGPNLELVVGDTLTGGAVLPGFGVPVADLFRPVAPRPAVADAR